VTSDSRAQSTADVIAISESRMSRQAWLLFWSMGLLWGLPYLLIKVAVVEVSPTALAGARTILAALVLVPMAVRAGALRPALRLWPWVFAFALMEIAIPWVLVANAETRVTSGFAGLMIASVPIVGAVVSWILGDHHALDRVRLMGLAVGVLGVGALVGLDSLAGQIDVLSVVELILVAVGYAAAPALAARRLAGVPSIGVLAVAFFGVAAMYAPTTFGELSHGLPSPKVIGAVLVLAFVCSALAFILFFKLMALVGPARSTVITFVNPGVAIVLGVIVLQEPLTLGTVVGFPLVLFGSYLATRSPAKLS